MRTVQEYFCEYEQHHCNKLNKVTHYVGIPMILVGLLGLLAQISYLQFSVGNFTIDAAIITTVVVYVLFYVRLHFVLSLFMLACFVGFYAIAMYSGNLYILWGLFIIGWILQLLGHVVFEKEKPSFLENLVHLLIGPLWILNSIVRCVK